MRKRLTAQKIKYDRQTTFEHQDGHEYFVCIRWGEKDDDPSLCENLTSTAANRIVRKINSIEEKF